MLEIIQDTIIDSVKLLPFLFITYFNYGIYRTQNK